MQKTCENSSNLKWMLPFDKLFWHLRTFYGSFATKNCCASKPSSGTNLQKKLVKTQITSLHLTFSDDSTFKDILRFICDEELLRVKAIVWNILPNVRKDALLTKQARLINLFKPKEIWHNVVIVCKQSRNPEDDAQVPYFLISVVAAATILFWNLQTLKISNSFLINFSLM